MKIRCAALALVLLGTATVVVRPLVAGEPADAADPESGVSESSELTREGFGPIKLGMTAEEAMAAAGDGASYRPPDPDGSYCGELTTSVTDVFVLTHPQEGQPDRVVYIVSLNDSVRTDKGIGMGDIAGAVRKRYPDAEPGYDEQGRALVVAGTPGELAFRVDVDVEAPIPDDAAVDGLAVTASELTSYDEYCA